jgi:hypothetical protein
MARYLISVSFALLGVFASAVLARCQYTVLRSSTDEYLDSQKYGELSELFAKPGITYIENNIVTDIKASILGKPLKIAFDRTLIDQDSCATFTEIIVTEGASGPWVIGTQLRFNESTDGDARVTADSIDVVASTVGDLLFNATETLKYSEKERWWPIDDIDNRATRDQLKEAADAYLDLWTNASAPVPWGVPCNRLEGGIYTGNGTAEDSCKVGVPETVQAPNTNRRYVIDDSAGSINVLFTFGALGNAPDSHSFRIENGKLRYVHTITVLRNLTSASTPATPV